MADAALHLPLLFLGGVVVAVLGQIAELAGGLDLAGDVDAAARRQLLELGSAAGRRRPGTDAAYPAWKPMLPAGTTGRGDGRTVTLASAVRHHPLGSHHSVAHANPRVRSSTVHLGGRFLGFREHM